MVMRFRKKVRRQRGSKLHGWGAKKKHRGKGSKGGHGFAGLLKHKKMWMLANDPEHFGRTGFKVPQRVARKSGEKAINIRDLDKISEGKKEINLSELGYGKLLSFGKITKPLVVKVAKFTEGARRKIEEAGGKIISENISKGEKEG